jgi:RNase H-like domain found in reverse transcriptase
LALLTAVEKWRHYLQGRPFVIRTDHISLKYLLEQKLTHALQHKGLCKMLGLDYVVQYKKGSENITADALSRQRTHDDLGEIEAVTELLPSWLEELKGSYVQDEWALQVLSQYSKKETLEKEVTVHEGIIRKGCRIYVGTSMNWRSKIIQVLHDSSLGGHSGIVGVSL